MISSSILAMISAHSSCAFVSLSNKKARTFKQNSTAMLEGYINIK
jgi:hypothetical protein